MGNLQELKQKAKERADQQAELRHKYRMENHKHYRSWFLIDSQLNQWRDKTDSIPHKNTLGKLLEHLIILYAEIEMSPHPDSDNIGFDVIVEMNLQKDTEIKKLQKLVYDYREKLKEQSTQIETMQKGMKTLQAEIEYYESENKK